MKKLIVWVGLLACLFSVGILNAQEKKNNYSNSPARKLQIAEYAIANLYVDQPDEDKLVESAIMGMLKELDPHSTYANPEEVKKLNEEIGVTPAQKAAMEVGSMFSWNAIGADPKQYNEYGFPVKKKEEREER